VRIDSVAREIVNSGAQLAAISSSHGFSDLPSMSRQFKRFVGTTPSRYRRRAAVTNVRNRQFNVAERAN
jgi:AraC-like DNA-binding protein